LSETGQRLKADLDSLTLRDAEEEVSIIINATQAILNQSLYVSSKPMIN
jgi:hypothetical protein